MFGSSCAPNLAFVDAASNELIVVSINGNPRRPIPVTLTCGINCGTFFIDSRYTNEPRGCFASLINPLSRTDQCKADLSVLVFIFLFVTRTTYIVARIMNCRTVRENLKSHGT